MVMMGQYCLGDIPFTDVFIHAMIQDGEGRKMSKSLGNGIDPLDIIDSHGADAMRFTLVSMTTQTQDVRLPVERMTLPDGRVANSSPKFDIGRNFCNKLWNASRFAMMNLEPLAAWSDIRPTESLPDRWILSRLSATVRDATAALEAYRFNELVERLYHFMWDDFCDRYLEIAKGRITAGEHAPGAILAHCLDVLLRLLHPICPFVTEAIWLHLNESVPVRGPGDSPAEPLLARARWPQADAAAINTAAEEQFELIWAPIRGVRNLRAEHNVPPGKTVEVHLAQSGRTGSIIAENKELFEDQCASDVVFHDGSSLKPPPDAAIVTSSDMTFYVSDIIDLQAELARRKKQAETLKRGIESIEKKLANENFVAKAPPEVVLRQRERLGELRRELETVTKALDAATEQT